ncbi:hypothetical protein B0H16DRAFT_1712017 [Mycena metata]|uniref:Uncharacterized protein n=1 Tax=Mycena metata TaxID=1033252 RepID=A0AAD7K4Z7_9AGAR|nr:hypothetical protein B0H16DRAFT_1712017 [Mycena metata]
MTLHRPHTAEELTYFASQMRVADPNVDNGSFSSLTTKETMEWIMVENAKRQHEIASDDLRVLLWDMQRFDYLFPEARYSLRPNFDIMRLESWPQWKTPHRNVLRNVSVSPQKTTTGEESAVGADELVSPILVVTNFNLLAFSPNDLAYGHFTMPPEGMFGNWTWRQEDNNVSKGILFDVNFTPFIPGGGEIPFLVYFHEDTLMIMEVLDVKRVSWPDPGRGRFFQKLVENQESKYGPYEGGPLAPALETPKVPLVLIRYSYTEGRPKGGSKFMPYLESRLRDRLPPGTSNDNIRLELEKHILAGQQVS